MNTELIKKLNRLVLISLFGGGLATFSTIANADFIGTYSGNDCSGEFGTGFENCKIPKEVDPNQSPVIIKFERNSENGWNTPEINPLFSTIDGTEFSFTFDSNNGSAGTWTYNPGVGDPAINYFVAKGGPSFNLFSNTGNPFSDSWSTPTNPNNNKLYGLSHLSFYDTGTTGPGGHDIPEPVSLLLFGAGLLGLSFSRRFKLA